MNSVGTASHLSARYTLVFDNRCSWIERLSQIVSKWDRFHAFTLVARENTNAAYQTLIDELDGSRWNLLLIDDFDHRWTGPEAIPIILKNLPFGKIAAVLYIIPGTMWLTQKLYLLISRNRRRLAKV